MDKIMENIKKIYGEEQRKVEKSFVVITFNKNIS
jgi:hypothetical protein